MGETLEIATPGLDVTHGCSASSINATKTYPSLLKSVPLVQHSMRQIIKSLTYVCHLFYGYNSHSILMKLCTVVWNPKGKIEFTGIKQL